MGWPVGRVLGVPVPIATRPPGYPAQPPGGVGCQVAGAAYIKGGPYLLSVVSSLIPAVEAIAILRAAGVNAQKSPAPRGRCRTLCYLVAGQYVNLGRLRQLAREALAAQAEPAPSPALPGEARPGAAAPDARPVLPGEAEPPAPVAQDGPAPELPRLRADAAAGRPVSLAALARALADDLATPAPTPDSLRARAAVRGAEAERVADAEPARAQAAADQAQTLTAWADSLSPAPVADAWAGQPWNPGTPDARARVALQGERVATLWPIAQAVKGAGFDLPPVWWADGPVMAGERTYEQALAALPLGAIAAAAAALAALPPVTTAQARALRLCLGEAALV